MESNCLILEDILRGACSYEKQKQFQQKIFKIKEEEIRIKTEILAKLKIVFFDLLANNF